MNTIHLILHSHYGENKPSLFLINKNDEYGFFSLKVSDSDMPSIDSIIQKELFAETGFDIDEFMIRKIDKINKKKNVDNVLFYEYSINHYDKLEINKTGMFKNVFVEKDYFKGIYVFNSDYNVNHIFNKYYTDIIFSLNYNILKQSRLNQSYWNVSKNNRSMQLSSSKKQYSISLVNNKIKIGVQKTLRSEDEALNFQESISTFKGEYQHLIDLGFDNSQYNTKVYCDLEISCE